jgi:hypothetical protein
MSSRQKRKQARRNGAMAAGTKSPEGLKQSSMNALRHGLTAKAVVLTNESQAKFDELRLEYVNRFLPQDGVEMDLVDDMVGARWRLRRITIMQTAAFDLQMDKDEAEIKKCFDKIDEPTRTVVAFGKLTNGEKTLELLIRYETTYSRMYDRAMKALQRLQMDRLEGGPSATSEEMRNDVAPAASEPVPAPESVPSDAEMKDLLAGLPPETLLQLAEKLNIALPPGEPPLESEK